MSNFNGQIHDVATYNPKTSKPLDGQRLAVITWKTDRVSGIKPDSQCVSIPRLQDSPAELDSLLLAVRPWIIRQIEQVQNNLIRDQLPTSQVSQESISFEKIKAAILELGSRSAASYSDDEIKEFFAEELHPSLTIAFASKMGISSSEVPTAAQETKILQLSAAFRDSFVSLAKTKIPPVPAKLEQLEKALSLLPSDCDNEIASFLAARIAKFKAAPSESMLLDAL